MSQGFAKIRPDGTKNKNKKQPNDSYILDRTVHPVRPHSAHIVRHVQAFSLSEQKNSLYYLDQILITCHLSVAIHPSILYSNTHRTASLTAVPWPGDLRRYMDIRILLTWGVDSRHCMTLTCNLQLLAHLQVLWRLVCLQVVSIWFNIVNKV